MQTLTPKNLYGPAFLDTTSAALVTAPSSTTYLITAIVLHNSSASAATYYLYLGGEATSTRLFSASLDPDQTVVIAIGGGGLVLEATDHLDGKASALSSIVCTIHGGEVV